MSNATKMTPDDGVIKIILTNNPKLQQIDAIDYPKILYKMGQISPLVALLCNIFGSQIAVQPPDWQALRLVFSPFNDLFPISPEVFVDGLFLVADELKINAKLLRPLPLNKAVTNSNLVPVLRTIAYCNAEVTFEKGNCSRIIPILAIKDFDEPAKIDSNKNMGSHKIMGLYRSLDKNIGHGVYIGKDSIPVRFPVNDPKWQWSMLHDILDFSCRLEVGIERDKKGDEWRPVKNSTILRQLKLIF